MTNYRDLKHPLAGGAEVHLHRIFTKIAQKGHEILLVTTRFSGCLNEEVCEGIRILRLGGDLSFQWQVAKRWKKIVRAFQPDVVVEDLNKLPLYLPFYCRFPRLIQIHHLWGQSIFREASFPVALTVWLQERLIPWVYKKDCFAVVSPSTAGELVRLGISPTQSTLIYNGCEMEAVARPAEDKIQQPYFLWLGRLRRYKGVFVALEALKHLLKTNPKASLVFAGDGPARSQMIKYIRKHHLEQNVQLVGRVDEEQKKIWMHGAVGLIQSSYKEGWGLTVIEAARQGTVAVASDVPGLRDSVRHGETGFLVPAGDSQGFAHKMRYLLEDTQSRQTLEMKALRWSQEFDWDRAATQTLELLQKLVEKGRRD